MQSAHKSDLGKFVLTAGKFYGDAEKDKGKYYNLMLHNGNCEYVCAVNVVQVCNKKVVLKCKIIAC